MNTRILTGEGISKAIKDIKPQRIAVAYLGNNWQEYLPEPENLDAVVISPRLGTSPRAVEALAKLLGWDRIFFDENLHAKLYLGEHGAVLGSANLSNNGLGPGGLTELCCRIDEREELHRLDRFFCSVLDSASRQFPETSKKIERLHRLQDETQCNPQLARSFERKERSFLDIDAQASNFYVTYCIDADYSYTAAAEALQPVILDESHFAESDELVLGKWILRWQMNQYARPHGSTNPRWMVIDKVISAGVDDGPYTKLAIQLSNKDDRGREKDAPFELTPSVIKVLREALLEKEIRKYLVQEEAEIWSLAYSLPGVPLLVKRMQEKLRQQHQTGHCDMAVVD